MGEKDLIEKKLEDYNDVFADIFNTLLFGQQRLSSEYLKNGPTLSLYKAAAGTLREQGRDVAKEYHNEAQFVIASFGIENQSYYDATMPVRIMGYDYGSYRQQIDKGSMPLHPVITLVLNFSNDRWKKNKSLHQMLKLSEEWKAYVQDYKIFVFDIAYLEDETIDRFQSDFKLVARFFKDRRLHQDSFTGNNTIIKHAEAFMELLSVFTSDSIYQENIPAIRREKEAGKEIPMCWVVESHIEKGRLIGLEEGKLIGYQSGKEDGILAGREEGRLAGHEEGRLAGREEEACLTARMLFKNNASMELVSTCIPHLSPEKLMEIYEQVQLENNSQ